ncbi:N-acetylmuramoyl-L-alanine amidase [Ruminococcus sp.]|uniref:N-acetylmuramoyl-L-alanine amidase n=1 Tax=Ruminococcus sp. TaxID=41978 RepID=UPI0025F4C970|nr:N-acetylmuramoyl-L-alanine amidase [Ruminococcus sp.]MBQ8965373.1 N-acetylmuramoyl-L-alanine amidase [Ruminococcus sp.]
MYKMTDEEFYEVYGRMPRRAQPRKKKVKVYWGRIIIALIILALIIFGIVKLILFIVGKVKGGKEEPNKVTVSSAVDSDDDYYAEPENKEKHTEYNGIELTVCIDAAHGGFDKGTEDGSGRAEKDDTLKIAQALKEHLEGCGVKVVMTREDDSYLTVEQRSSIANSQGADLTISIHRSSSEVPGSDLHGFEAWIHSAQPEMDKAFAGKIMSKLQEMGISENKGVHVGYPEDKTADYPINEKTSMPSILLDMGYVTSDIDNQLLDANLEAYARAIGNGIIETAVDLGIVDENGARLKEGQLRSDKPAAEAELVVAKTDDSTGSSESIAEESSFAEETDDSTYNEWGYEEPADSSQYEEQTEDEYVYTADGMGYYTEPMMTE